jgi:DNA-directed RNA polymerase subunit RPC12/RpoP
MKLHDLLVYELIKPTRYKEPTGFIIKLIGSGDIAWRLEETETLQQRATHSLETIVDYITPDIKVTRLRPAQDESPTVVVEVETDIDFDFAESLRQTKKYRRITPDVRVVIPKEYENFAPLYTNESFRIWFWEGNRILECLRCKNKIEIKGPYEPKCTSCGNKTTKHRLIGLKDVKFSEFTS